MIHNKVDSYPNGMGEKEIKAVSTQEDVYDIFETFDTLEDAFSFIKDKYGENALEYARKDAEENINEEKDFIEYKKKIGEPDYIGYTSFDISEIEDTSYFWFSTGRVARIKLF